jgi:hypothetical protein
MISSTQNYTTEKKHLHLFKPTHESSLSGEELSKIIHTAFVGSHADDKTEASYESIESLMKTPAFQTLINATIDLSQNENISELEAAKKIIGTIKSLDQIWKTLLIKEGLKTLSS